MRTFTRLVSTLLLALVLTACALAVSFDDFNAYLGALEIEASTDASRPEVASPPPKPMPIVLYPVSGQVDGLEGQKVTLVLAGTRMEVGDGPFAFPALVADGTSYSVGLANEPAGHVCFSERASGLIVGGPATTVAVHCPSMDAALTGLNLSAASIAPAFSATSFAYTAALPTSGFVSLQSTTVIATTRNPNARLKIAGLVATSGAPSAPIALARGDNLIDVAVTAADAKTEMHYTVTVSVASATADVYVKASNTRPSASFGVSIALSDNTLVVGSPRESSAASGIDGNQSDTSLSGAGAVYVFTGGGGAWSQEAYIKASSPRLNNEFGASVAIDGDTLVVGSPNDGSNATGVNGDESNTSALYAGAAHVFRRVGATWAQEAYLKASNTTGNTLFGNAVAISGNTIVVGAYAEDGSVSNGGAVYVFTRTGTTWSQQAYLKPPPPLITELQFGKSVALDSETLAVGAPGASGGGAAYVFTRTATTWSRQANIQASNARAGAEFGNAIAVSGNTLAVGSHFESSAAIGINGNQASTSAPRAGAAYVFTRTGASWAQQAYVKASNTRASVQFGGSVALLGEVLAIGSAGESSNATGVDGNQVDASAASAGAVYLLARAGTSWSQRAYVKATNTRASALFSASVALSSTLLGVGSNGESSNAVGVGGNQTSTSANNSGAVYLY